ncbi:hypothetical protein Agabi119p4_1189 [Agaricus bisporus var. burnettii]|uniref:Uncharacterized protein n=1 Tax=Agaricus bisporus var. burnettii TaxID=192524 RepID=A0A8H7FC38_AGABI|nr:hypothetical protein Agabi119p4_1189 [Agaricus bisporus var. burnettii]
MPLPPDLGRICVECGKDFSTMKSGSARRHRTRCTHSLVQVIYPSLVTEGHEIMELIARGPGRYFICHRCDNPFRTSLEMMRHAPQCCVRPTRDVIPAYPNYVLFYGTDAPKLNTAGR